MKFKVYLELLLMLYDKFNLFMGIYKDLDVLFCLCKYGKSIRIWYLIVKMCSGDFSGSNELVNWMIKDCSFI